MKSFIFYEQTKTLFYRTKKPKLLEAGSSKGSMQSSVGSPHQAVTNNILIKQPTNIKQLEAGSSKGSWQYSVGTLL